MVAGSIRTALVVVGVFTAALTAALLLGRGDDESGAGEFRDPNNPVVCVELGGGGITEAPYTETQVVDLLASGWEDALANHRASQAVPAVEYGCPGDPVLRCPGKATPHLTILCSETSVPVSSPGRYLRHVFIVSDHDFDLITGKSLGAYSGRGMGIEHTCSGDSCHQVTSALYVSLGELSDQEGLAAALAEGLGFVNPAEEPTVGEPTIDPLRWSTRTRLAACVEYAGELSNVSDAQQASAQQHVLGALQQIAIDSRWDYPASLRAAANAASAAYGCPRDPVFECYADPPISCLWENRLMPQPSDFLVFVFVVSESDIAKIAATTDIRVATIEQICRSGYRCRDVTFSVYVTPDQLADQQSLFDAISDAIAA
jgi:hypothetical protein